MEFNTKSIHKVLTEVLGDDVSPDDHEYSIARQRALEWAKSWKSKTLQLMLVCYSISFFPPAIMISGIDDLFKNHLLPLIETDPLSDFARQSTDEFRLAIKLTRSTPDLY
jgi:hypothetical protein